MPSRRTLRYLPSEGLRFQGGPYSKCFADRETVRDQFSATPPGWSGHARNRTSGSTIRYRRQILLLACIAFLQYVVAPGGLGQPVLVISDGAPGLCTALDLVFPNVRRQRCLVHRFWNVTAKVSKVDQDAVRGDFWEIFVIDDKFAPGE